MTVQAVIAVSPKAFLLVWWIVQLFHVLCIAYAWGVISVHQYVIAQNLQVIVDYLGHNAFSYFQPVIATMHVVIACHGLEFVRTVWCSIQAREFRFTKRPIARNATRPVECKPLESHGPTAASMLTPVAKKYPLAMFTTVWDALWTRLKMCRISDARYDSFFFVFEVIEVSMQTFQASKLSGLVPAVWINRLYAAVLIANCWSTAFVHRAVSTNQLVKRVLLVVVDSLFDLVTNMGIPCAIFLPYYWQFDLSLRDFPMDNYYNDVWLIQAISENQQVFVTSWLDFVSKMAPHLSVFGAIWVIKLTIVEDTLSRTKPSEVDRPGSIKRRGADHLPRLANLLPSAKTRVRVGSTLQRLSNTVIGSRTGSGGPTRMTSSQRLAVTMELFAARKHWWQDILFLVYGLLILVVHIHTTFVATSGSITGCMLSMRPWLTVHPTCVSFEINCAHGQHDHGRDVASLGSAFAPVEADALKALVLSGCPQLHVPPAIHTLPALQMIKIYNSTVETWDESAALREDRNPSLLLIYICDTNFSTPELPTGMLGMDIPRQLVDVEFSGTNLERLPPNLHEIWTGIMYFVLERSPGIDEFPGTLVKMKIPQMMLCSNNIRSIPDDLLADQGFWKLMLDGNPLEKLPSTIGAVRYLYKVGVAFTNVAAFPDWATIDLSASGHDDVPFLGYVDLYAGGSPLCASSESTASSSTNLSRWYRLDCSLDAPRHAYPIEREREWRAAAQAAWIDRD